MSGRFSACTHVGILMTEGQQRLWEHDRVADEPGRGEASPSASPPTSASIPAPTSDVAAAQQRLKDRGYYLGPVDGVLGAATEAALRAYQRDRGPKVTGRLDSPTVRSLTS